MPASRSEAFAESKDRYLLKFAGAASRNSPTLGLTNSLRRSSSPHMMKHRTLEQWMRIGFIVLFLVGMVCSMIIVLAYLK
jgi:hypothetical protein